MLDFPAVRTERIAETLTDRIPLTNAAFRLDTEERGNKKDSVPFSGGTSIMIPSVLRWPLSHAQKYSLPVQ